MKTNFSLLFYLKRQKNYISGNAPIYMRIITVQGKRAEMTTGRYCDPSRWNARAGKTTGNKDEVKLFNAYLDQLQAQVYKAQQSLADVAELITAEAIKNRFLGKSVLSQSLLEAVKAHSQKMKALVGKDYL